MNKKQKLPYGECKYKSIIEEGYYYVDKTEYIRVLEDLETKNIMFIRPRRFGKSLFVSMLDYYYNIIYKDQFDKLFGNYYIGKNPTPKKNSYYVLNFDFSGIETTTYESTYKGFLNIVKFSIKKFFNMYNHIFNVHDHEIKEIFSETTPSDMFKNFLSTIQHFSGIYIYVIIDEYDHFANELLSFKIGIYKKATTEDGFVRKFYEAIKEGKKSVVDRIFITGVTPIMLDSVTSGFNIAKNKSTAKELNEMLGFKSNEVKDLINLTVENCPNLNVDELFDEMKQYYDGYLFNEDANERVFNSDMVLYFLTEIKECKKPKELLDSNIMSDYRKIKNLFHINNYKENYKTLRNLIENQQLAGTIVDKFNLEKKFEKNDLISLLFYTGIISIKDYKGKLIYFKIPNYVIKELYFDYFVKILEESANYQIDTTIIDLAINNMAYDGDINDFIIVVEKFLKELSGRDFIKFDEKYIKIIILNYLMLSKIYFVTSEKENELGYKDITCIGRDIYDIKHHWILEIKYLKVQHTPEEFEQKKKEALEQIQKYEIKENFKGILHKVVLIFTGYKCSYISDKTKF